MDAQGARRARPFVEKAELTVPALVDRNGLLWERFDFDVVPLQLYFDETGRHVYRSIGAPEGDVLERLDEALKVPRQATPAPPSKVGDAQPAEGDVASLFERGVAALDGGRREEALAHWREALAQDPDNWLIRKQIWTVENPEKFWSGDIDFDWQRKKLAAEKSMR